MGGNLSPWAWLLIGFIIGWVLEWAVDLWLRKRREQAEITRLQGELSRKEAELRTAQERVRALEEKLFAEEPSGVEGAGEPPSLILEEEVTPLAEEVVIPSLPSDTPGIRAVPSPVDQGDDLASIPGLGPAYARLLKEVGVLTYEDLARLDEQDLRALLRVRPSWEGIDIAACLAEARRRAGLAEEGAGAQEPPAEAAVTEEAAEELAKQREEEARWDDLTRIKGIGRTYAERLRSAGIRTFRDLSELSESQLKEIVRPAEWQNVDLKSWIEQARALAARE